MVKDKKKGYWSKNFSKSLSDWRSDKLKLDLAISLGSCITLGAGAFFGLKLDLPSVIVGALAWFPSSLVALFFYRFLFVTPRILWEEIQQEVTALQYSLSEMKNNKPTVTVTPSIGEKGYWAYLGVRNEGPLKADFEVRVRGTSPWPEIGNDSSSDSIEYSGQWREDTHLRLMPIAAGGSGVINVAEVLTVFVDGSVLIFKELRLHSTSATDGFTRSVPFGEGIRIEIEVLAEPPLACSCRRKYVLKRGKEGLFEWFREFDTDVNAN